MSMSSSVTVIKLIMLHVNDFISVNHRKGQTLPRDEIKYSMLKDPWNM